MKFNGFCNIEMLQIEVVQSAILGKRQKTAGYAGFDSARSSSRLKAARREPQIR